MVRINSSQCETETNIT